MIGIKQILNELPIAIQRGREDGFRLWYETYQKILHAHLESVSRTGRGYISLGCFIQIAEEVILDQVDFYAEKQNLLDFANRWIEVLESQPIEIWIGQ
jgi:hypothetical protein